MTKQIYLASASPRRKEIMAKVGFEFEVVLPEVSEDTDILEPWNVVMELAFRKANAAHQMLAKLEREAAEFTVIGADTIVAIGNQNMGKPENKEEAIAMLTQLQGKIHQVYTGVTLLFCKGEIVTHKTFYECTQVDVYEMSAMQIEEYVATGEPMDKAGSYAIQGEFRKFVRSITGNYDNVVGLPISRLYHVWMDETN